MIPSTPAAAAALARANRHNRYHPTTRSLLFRIIAA
jgi:hypothetical protein